MSGLPQQESQGIVPNDESVIPAAPQEKAAPPQPKSNARRKVARQNKVKPKRSLFDHGINIICALILVYFIVNEYSHLYRAHATVQAAAVELESHYVFAPVFPYVGHYYLAKPKGYDPKYKYPIVVSLHGVSSRSYSAEVLLSEPARSRWPFFVMIPLAPPRAFWASSADEMYQLPRGIPFPDHIPFVVAGVKQAASQYNIDMDKVILTGHSMGASGVIGGMQRYPAFFSAGIASAGLWSPDELHNIQKPLYIFHGTEDQQIPFEFARAIRRESTASNLPITVTALKGRGHGIGADIYSDTLWHAALNGVN